MIDTTDRYNKEISKIEESLDSLESNLKVLQGIESKLADAKRRSYGFDFYEPDTNSRKTKEYSFFERLMEFVFGERFYSWQIKKYSKEGIKKDEEFEGKLKKVHDHMLITGLKVKDHSESYQCFQVCETRMHNLYKRYATLYHIQEARQPVNLNQIYPPPELKRLRLDRIDSKKLNEFEKDLEIGFYR